jgi:predicted SAM-dependent methyltransferase
MTRRLSGEEKPFWDKVFTGKGIDIGAGDDLIAIEGAVGFDVEDGDANRIHEYFSPNSFDYVHASQCLEHMHDPVQALKSWMKILKQGGYAVVTIPSWELYEGMVWPSRYNPDHKSTFSMWQKGSPAPNHVLFPDWLKDNFGEHKVEMCRLVDTNYNYKVGTSVDQTFNRENAVEAFIEFILKKDLAL